MSDDDRATSTMSLYLYPMAVPYRSAGGNAVRGVVHVDAIGADAEAATSEALALAEAWLRLRQRGAGASVDTQRVVIGQPVPQAPGLVVRPFGPADRIPALAFPARVDHEHGERLGEVFAGFDQSLTAVLLDCRRLEYINTIGLAGLTSHVRRLPLHLFAVREQVRKVLEIVGLTRLLRIHADLDQALTAIAPR